MRWKDRNGFRYFYVSEVGSDFLHSLSFFFFFPVHGKIRQLSTVEARLAQGIVLRPDNWTHCVPSYE